MGKSQDAARKIQRSVAPTYESFDQLDGRHPWMEKMPEGFISYPVRELHEGKIAYFNFALAKEMGLIESNHEPRMNKKLATKLLSTFSIRIINEYDQANNIIYHPRIIKKNRYMATRYLQLQHPSKSGKTSGDGRCVWNGTIEHKGITWDVSSRGTGVTAFAPGVIEAGKPLRSGNNQVGYGCGMAEIDELYAAALMAEIFHQNGLETERVLCIVDLGKGVGIGVRAATNLLRPAHLFMYLKQNNHDALKRSVDYLIDRQIHNGKWGADLRGAKKYERMLELLARSFGNFAAILDRDYIFAWLDWDGDNMLIDGGIIDYGSVRQFGLRHDEYRYDDVQRFSTSLNEQKSKARQIVQVFAQMTDFLLTGSKKPVSRFRQNAALKIFDTEFKNSLLDRFLYQLGLGPDDRKFLLNTHRARVQELFYNYSYLEKVKTFRKISKVADGVNRPAIFNMRAINRWLPQALEGSPRHNLLAPKEFFKVMLASSAEKKEGKTRLTDKLKKRILRLQRQYRRLAERLAHHHGETLATVFARMKDRSLIINREDRITGNALVNIVDEILAFKKQGLRDTEIQKIMDEFIISQSLESKAPRPGKNTHPKAYKLRQKIDLLLFGHREDI